MMSPEPKRIVSLVPSDSYTLARLGVADRLVGRTEYCVAPPEIQPVPTVGGTKNVDMARIIELCPDLVVANMEENRRIDIERLQAAGTRVLCSFPCTVWDGFVHTERLAALFPSIDNREMLAVLRAHYERHAACERKPPLPTFVPIWMDPLMTAHGDTFLSSVLALCGAANVFADRRRRYPLRADLGLSEPVASGDRDTRYPRVTLEEVAARRPALVLLPDEPHEFTVADAEIFSVLAGPPAIRFINGKSLMWYGVRALEDLDEVATLIASVADRQA